MFQKGEGKWGLRNGEVGLVGVVTTWESLPTCMERRGKLELGWVLRKVRLGHGASVPRQGSDRVTAQGRVKLRVVELTMNSS